MHLSYPKKAWRIFGAVGLAALTVATLGVQLASASHNAPASKPAVTHMAAKSGIAITGHATVNFATLPKVTPNSAAPSNANYAAVNRPRMSPAELAAYLKQAQHLSSMPARPGNAKGPSASSTSSNVPSPNYQIAPVSHNFEGINETQSGCGCQPPDQALAASSGFTLEGVNTAFSIYNYAGALVAGPTSYNTFFAPLHHTGDFLSDPHLYYDGGTGRWVSVIDEVHSCGSCGQGVDGGYFDIAISANGTPTGTWYLFQFSTNTGINANGDWSDFPQMGIDAYGLYLTGIQFDNATGGFLGNATYAMQKNKFWNNQVGAIWFWGTINNGLGAPAYRIAPAQELGTPDAEWEVATDAGYSGTNNHLTLVALTHTSILNSGGAPTLTAMVGTIPAYADPPGVSQPGTSNLLANGHAGPESPIQYQGGHLLMAWGTAVNWSGDSATRSGAYWLDITPVLQPLSAHNPPWVAGYYTNQGNVFGYVGAYEYYPSLEASSELDEVLNFEYASPGVSGGAPAAYPSIAYTSRRSTDFASTLGQDNASSIYTVVGTTFTTGSRWGDYSACALSTFQPYVQDGVRGYIWCAGEYMGSASFWQTHIYSVRAQ
ncbi:MAG: hypothetical protein ACHQ4H_15180 [Ktedonobacterales bacterium]